MGKNDAYSNGALLETLKNIGFKVDFYAGGSYLNLKDIECIMIELMRKLGYDIIKVFQITYY